MINSSDNIYAQKQSANPFQFDEKVAAVFPDMIERSVPGYADVIHHIRLLSSIYISSKTNCYDLGCSLGAATLAMSCGNKQPDVEIIGVDNSLAMIERCRNNIDNFKHQTPIKLIKENIQNVDIKNASMVVLNYTLQFIPQVERYEVLNCIFKGMVSGGILVLSEKIIFSDQRINQLMIELHHQFKRDNGYSELEISQKRNALETVLVPEERNSHIERLQKIGFNHVGCLQQKLNFATFIAIKA